MLTDALSKCRAFVTFLKQSSLARKELINLQKELGWEPLAPMMGTINRSNSK